MASIEKAKEQERRRGWMISETIRQYVCIVENLDSFVAWAPTREAAIAECTAKCGKPVHVWATGRKILRAAHSDG